MAQTYLPFPTSLDVEEALLIRIVLHDCIPCNVICMAPHTVARHARYTHIHTLGSNVFITITTQVCSNGTPHMNTFKALIEDTNRLLMKGVLLPVGHYPVSDTLGGAQTLPSSTASAPVAGISTDVSMGSAEASGPASTMSTSLPSGI